MMPSPSPEVDGSDSSESSSEEEEEEEQPVLPLNKSKQLQGQCSIINNLVTESAARPPDNPPTKRARRGDEVGV